MQSTPQTLVHALSDAARIGWVVIAVALTSCGGDDGGGGGGSAGGGGPGVTATEFEVVSGGGACGGGCGSDSPSGDGVGAGDGGGDGAGGGLGEMRNVKVTARKPDGTVLGSAALSGNLVSLYPRTYTGPFILEFGDDGSGNGEYFDESLKTWVALGSQLVHVLVPALTHHVSANVLSEAAYQWAIKQYGSEAALNADRMTTANNTVRDAFNARTPAPYRVTDVTNYTVAVSDLTTPGSLPNTHAGRYGTLIGAMPRVRPAVTTTLPKPAIAFMNQLVLDLLDDSIVNNSATPPAGERAYDSNLTVTLADAIASVRADYASGEQPAPSAAANICLNTALVTVGGTWSLSYEDNDNGNITTENLTFEVVRRTTDFQGIDALETKLITNGTSPFFTYFDPNLSGGLIAYGSVDTFTVPPIGVTTITVVNVPPITPDRQFLLRPDETQTITSTFDATTRDALGNIIAGPTRTSATKTTTFLGYEDVTVAAGAFLNACKYSIESSGVTTTSWITSSGQGVEVKSESGTFTSQLASGTVNGEPVR